MSSSDSVDEFGSDNNLKPAKRTRLDNGSDSVDEFGSDNNHIPAKRTRLDNGSDSVDEFGSDNNHKPARTRLDYSGSATHDSDGEPSDTASYGLGHNKEKGSQEDIRLSRSSSSDNDQHEDDRQESEDQGNDTPNEDRFQESSERNYDKNSDQEGSVSGDTIKDIYSDKAKRMMKKMGYRDGKGLGKDESGRTAPVEASSQKGRRGLGLAPSVVGDVPLNFKWTPDDSKPSAKETVSWMPSPPEEPLSGYDLEEWLLRGPTNLTIDNETLYVDPEILKGVLSSKSIFDKLQDKDLREARMRSNPYETIGSNIFLNRAAVKMANMDAVFDNMFTKPLKQDGSEAVEHKSEVLYFADVCAGPGGFSEYILFRTGWTAKGFGFTLKAQNDFKLSDFYAGTPETFNPHYGSEEDGNIFNPANLTSLKDAVLEATDDKGVHFLMADGGFSVEGKENIQEILSKQLYLCQCLAALMLVRTGGHFVVKLFDIFTPFSVSLVYIMYRCFEKVCIHKPVTSRPANSERYLVCKWKRRHTEPVENHLFSVNSHMWNERARDTDVTHLVPADVIQKDQEFYNYIRNSNCVIGEYQIRNLLKIAAFSKDRNLKEPSQNSIREQCLKLWNLPDKGRTQHKTMSADETLSTILGSMRVKPPNSNDMTAFKGSILGKLPRLLETADNLKLFNCALDWHFVFLNKSNNSDLKFFLGTGGKHVFELEGRKWQSSDKIMLPIPANTLFYGEIVDEIRIEKCQIYCKALHIVDAIALGGRDISYLPLNLRLHQCKLFCIALNKPFDPKCTPLRCKRLYQMENFAPELNNLEVRATKRMPNAVTIKVPMTNRHSNVQMIHTVGSILFMKAVIDTWQTRLSSKDKSKRYYFKKDGKKPPVDHLSIENALDTVGTHMSQILWSWDRAAVSIFENHQRKGVTRKQVEEYVSSHYI